MRDSGASIVNKVTSLNEHRDKCEWCGEVEHPMPLMCPRITKVKYGEDGEITVYFQDAPIIFKFGNGDSPTV